MVTVLLLSNIGIASVLRVLFLTQTIAVPQLAFSFCQSECFRKIIHSPVSAQQRQQPSNTFLGKNSLLYPYLFGVVHDGRGYFFVDSAAGRPAPGRCCYSGQSKSERHDYQLAIYTHIPDRLFHNFKASKSPDRRMLCCSEIYFKNVKICGLTNFMHCSKIVFLPWEPKTSRNG